MLYEKDKMNLILYKLLSVLLLFKLLSSYSTIINLPDVIDLSINLIYGIGMVLIILYTTYSYKSLIWISLIGVAALYTSYVTRDFYIVMSYLAIVSLKNIDLENVLIWMYKFKFIFVGYHFSLFFFNYLNNNVTATYRYGSDEARYSFHFNHPNVSSMIIIWALFEYIFVNYHKINKTRLLLLWLSYIPIYMINDSNTSLIIFNLVIILIIVHKIKGKTIDKYVKSISKYAFAILSIFSIVSVMLYTDPRFYEYINYVDKALTGRIRLGAKALLDYGPTILGQYINYGATLEWDSFYLADSLVLDSFYIKSFLNFGVVYLVLLSILIYKIAPLLKTKESIFLIAMIMYGAAEGYVVNTLLCFPMLFLGKYILVLSTNDNKREELNKSNTSPIITSRRISVD